MSGRSNTRKGSIPTSAWVGIGIAVVVAVALAIAVATSGSGGDDGVAQTRDVSVTGAGLPRYSDAGPDAALGMAMPELNGEAFDGSPIAITNDGRPKAILFLTHW